MQQHANATGCRLLIPEEPESVLLGSAMLGAVAAAPRTCKLLWLLCLGQDCYTATKLIFVNFTAPSTKYFIDSMKTSKLMLR